MCVCVCVCVCVFKENLALNNLQGLIWYKIQPTNKPTNVSCQHKLYRCNLAFVEIRRACPWLSFLIGTILPIESKDPPKSSWVWLLSSGNYVAYVFCNISHSCNRILPECQESQMKIHSCPSMMKISKFFVHHRERIFVQKPWKWLELNFWFLQSSYVDAIHNDAQIFIDP